jgi:acetyltransferase-like isoleucine patch superfamily enzyme
VPAAASPTVAPPAALLRAPAWRDRLRAARARRRGVRVGARVVLGRGLVLDLGPGAVVEIGDGAVIGNRCRFQVAAGACVRIGAGAMLGERCAVVAHASVEVEPRAVLADEVVLVDADARFDDVERPVRAQGLRAAPIVVGADVRIGPGAVVTRGVRVGAGAQVGAHAVVDADVAAGAVVDGVPAGNAPAASRSRGGAGAAAPRSGGRGGADAPRAR